jgi:hypothetical protein
MINFRCFVFVTSLTMYNLNTHDHMITVQVIFTFFVNKYLLSVVELVIKLMIWLTLITFLIPNHIPGADPIFQDRGGALKKIAPSGGRREHFWGISCEKSRFYAKKNHIFSNFRGARAGCALPPGFAPEFDAS